MRESSSCIHSGVSSGYHLSQWALGLKIGSDLETEQELFIFNFLLGNCPQVPILLLVWL